MLKSRKHVVQTRKKCHIIPGKQNTIVLTHIGKTYLRPQGVCGDILQSLITFLVRVTNCHPRNKKTIIYLTDFNNRSLLNKLIFLNFSKLWYQKGLI